VRRSSAADLLDRCHDDVPKRPRASRGLPVLELLVGLLDDHDGRVHHGADRDRDAGERHDVGREPQRAHGMKASSTAIGMVKIGMSALGMCQRNTRMTRLTMRSSSRGVVRRVMARVIRVERS